MGISSSNPNSQKNSNENKKLKSKDIGFFLLDDHISYQENFFQLKKDNMDLIVDFFKNTFKFNNKKYFYLLSHEILYYSQIKFFVSDLYIDFLFKMKEDIEFFKIFPEFEKIFIQESFNFIVNDRYYIFFLKKYYKKKLFSFNNICKQLVKYFEKKSNNFSYYPILIFLKDLYLENLDIYKNFISNINTDSNDDLIEIIQNSEKFFDYNWNLFEKSVNQGYIDNSIEDIIRNDKIEEFQLYYDEKYMEELIIQPSIYNQYSYLFNKPTFFQYSCYFNSIRIVKYLITKNFNISLVDSQGNSSYSYALISSDIELIRLLMNNISIPKDFLFFSIKYHLTGVVNWFLENYSNFFSSNQQLFEYMFNISSTFNNIYFFNLLKNKITKIDFNTFKISIINNNIGFFNFLIQLPIEKEFFDSDKNSLLHIVVQYSTYDVFELILNQNLYDIYCINNTNKTPFYLAVFYNNYKIIKYYLLNINDKIDFPDNFSITPFHQAVSNNNIELVKVLINISFINPNYFDNYQNNALFTCIKNGNITIFKLFLDNNRIKWDVYNGLGHNPLHSIAFQGNLEFFFNLIYSEKIKLNSLTKDGQSILHITVHFNIFNILTEIINSFNSIEINLKNMFGI